MTSATSDSDLSRESSGFRWKLGAALALIVFLAGCWMLFNANAARELAAAKAEWNASDPVLKFGKKPQDSPIVPDDKNILRAPVFCDWNRTGSGASSNPAWEKWAKRIEDSGKEPDPFGCDINRLFRPVPGKAGKPDSPAALSDIPGKSREAVLIEALERDLPELKTIPAEFASRPEISLGYRYTPTGALFGAPSPNWRATKNSSLVMNLYAVAQARAGDPHIAAQVAITGLRHENALLHAYTDICGSIAFLHFRQTVLRPVRALLLRHDRNEAELFSIQEALARINLPGRVCRNKTTGMLAIIDYLEKIRKSIGAAPLTSTDRWIEAAVFVGIPKGVYDLKHAQAIRRMKTTLDTGLRPDGSVNLAVFKAHNATLPNGEWPWNLSATESGFHIRQINSAARMQAWLNCALIACAIERHRLAAGTPPASLADLPAGLLKKVPVGPTTGLPPTYVTTPDGGYTLTYAREDFCDDDGNERAAPADIVWTSPPDRAR